MSRNVFPGPAPAPTRDKPISPSETPPRRPVPKALVAPRLPRWTPAPGAVHLETRGAAEGAPASRPQETPDGEDYRQLPSIYPTATHPPRPA